MNDISLRNRVYVNIALHFIGFFLGMKSVGVFGYNACLFLIFPLFALFAGWFSKGMFVGISCGLTVIVVYAIKISRPLVPIILKVGAVRRLENFLLNLNKNSLRGGEINGME